MVIQTKIFDLFLINVIFYKIYFRYECEVNESILQLINI